MGRRGKRWGIRSAAAGTAALLLVGCGSGSGAGNGSGGGKAGGDSHAKALGKAEVTSVMPDAKAVPGWRSVLEPSALPRNPEVPPPVCLTKSKKKHAATCDRITFWGVSGYARTSDAASLNFWALAYKDEKTADAAYDALAEYYGGDRVGVGAVPVPIGEPGQDRTANRAEVGSMGGPGTITQIRVGTTVLGFGTGSQGRKALPDEQVEALAAMFAERAQQAQDGDKPSATLTGR
ncbi:hypothetical protein ACFVW8_17100 [Streptomyces sp. NPDC058221]|uniref:hypothetical protein n=1 Tax=Streptomyces sp. NPDC058221 TaxID=3346388 RepID=UPI0036ED2D9D